MKKYLKTQERENLKTIRVVAAVIRRNNEIFETARGHGEFKGRWKFPGGKIEEGETSQVLKNSKRTQNRSSS